MSVWQTPQATRRTSTSPALRLGQLDLLHHERRAELLQYRSPHPHRQRSSEVGQLDAGTLRGRSRHAQARRAHGEAEVLARRRADRLDLEVAREHRQRGLALQEREVAAGAEARAGAEREEDRVGRGVQPAVGIEARDASPVVPAWRVSATTRVPAGRSTPATVVSAFGSTKMIGAVDFSRADSRNTASPKRIASAASALCGVRSAPSAASASAARRALRRAIAGQHRRSPTRACSRSCPRPRTAS